MRIVSYNVNGLRARMDAVLGFLTTHQPDVLLLQETKVGRGAFPAMELAMAGYDVVDAGAGGYAGVAVISRLPIVASRTGFGPDGLEALRKAAVDDDFDEAWVTDPRLVTAVVDAGTAGPVEVSSVYVPNGRELDHPHFRFKLAFLAALRDLEPLVDPGALRFVGGDINVAPAPVDCWAPRQWTNRTHVSPVERELVASFAAAGWVDTYRAVHGPDRVGYTWWNYVGGGLAKDQGLRIDVVFANQVPPPGTEVWVDVDGRRAERPSDHAALVVDWPPAS